MNSIKINPKLNLFKPQGVTKPNETELGVFYTNDMHGEVSRLAKLKSAHDEFKLQNSKIANLTLAAGDCLFGSDKQRNSLMVKLFNLMHIDALALGNHEFAGGTKSLSDSLDKADFKSVSCNIKLSDENPLKERLKDKKLVKSAVFMKGGHKFAVIGTSPSDSYISQKTNDTKVLDINETIKEINTEAKKLEAQGINKIILCSHTGYGEQGDLKIARETEGVDIIVGGHSHSVIDGVNTKTTDDTHKLNLLMSKRNEPVIITQAGGMNKYAGYLNVVFDENGVLKTEKISNKLVEVNQFKESRIAKSLMNKVLGKKVDLAKVNQEYNPKGSFDERFKENPLANLFTDAVREQTGADIVLCQAASVRGGVKDKITNYDVRFSMLPFNNRMEQIEISEKDLVNLLNSISGKILSSEKDPQILRCSGMRYSIHTDVEFAKSGDENALIDMQIADNKVDLKNPSDKKYKLVINDYLFSHDLTKDILAKYKKDAKFVGREQDLFIKYLEKHPKVDISPEENKRINLTCDTYKNLAEILELRREIVSMKKFKGQNINKCNK